MGYYEYTFERLSCPDCHACVRVWAVTSQTQEASLPEIDAHNGEARELLAAHDCEKDAGCSLNF
jgi:hypothetical protein